MALTLVRQGSRGEAVKKLQQLLNDTVALDSKLSVDGIFGPGTAKAVKAFQKKSNLSVDGVVGSNTWNALLAAAEKNQEINYADNPRANLGKIAAKYIGTKETGDNLAGDSKELLAIFKADNLVINGKTDGYPWCAAFVSFCVQKLFKTFPHFSGLVAPREASVSRFLNIWAKQQNCLIFSSKSELYKPQAGDIVVFTFSHIGIVERVEGNTITTIEGNTNDAGGREGTLVARKQRSTSIIKSFIRIPYSTMYIDSRLDSVTSTC